MQYNCIPLTCHLEWPISALIICLFIRKHASIPLTHSQSPTGILWTTPITKKNATLLSAIYSLVWTQDSMRHEDIWELCLCLCRVCPSKLGHRCVMTSWGTMDQKDIKEPKAPVWPTLQITQETWMLLLLARICLSTVSVNKLTLIVINKYEIYRLMSFLPTSITISWWWAYVS